MSENIVTFTSKPDDRFAIDIFRRGNEEDLRRNSLEGNLDINLISVAWLHPWDLPAGETQWRQDGDISYIAKGYTAKLLNGRDRELRYFIGILLPRRSMTMAMLRMWEGKKWKLSIVIARFVFCGCFYWLQQKSSTTSEWRAKLFTEISSLIMYVPGIKKLVHMVVFSWKKSSISKADFHRKLYCAAEPFIYSAAVHWNSFFPWQEVLLSCWCFACPTFQIYVFFTCRT